MWHLSPHCLMASTFVSAAREEPCPPEAEGPELPPVWHLNKVQGEEIGVGGQAAPSLHNLRRPGQHHLFPSSLPAAGHSLQVTLWAAILFLTLSARLGISLRSEHRQKTNVLFRKAVVTLRRRGRGDAVSRGGLIRWPCTPCSWCSGSRKRLCVCWGVGWGSGGVLWRQPGPRWRGWPAPSLPLFGGGAFFSPSGKI